MSIVYNKLDYNLYKKRMDILCHDENLKRLGFKRSVLGFSTYGYPIDYLSVGHGHHDLFIVGGTHSSEIIAVDYVLQLLGNISSFPEFDPNIFTLKVIPIQNPEGFDICTSCLSHIKFYEFEGKSKEYFLRYRTDSLIFKAVNDYNKLFGCHSAHLFLSRFKLLIDSANFKNLCDERAMPKISVFYNMVNELSDVTDFDELFNYLSCVSLSIIDRCENDLHDSFLKLFLGILNDSFVSRSRVDLTKYQKLHQSMFDGASSNNLVSSVLERRVHEVYSNNPNGSIITHDSTGQFINLNSNHMRNPGIGVIRNGEVKYGPGPKSNVRNYFPGPLGVPCLNPYVFKYATENELLYDLINKSRSAGRYFATILYHGTGGMIYYKPYLPLMNEIDYSMYLYFNKELSSVYNEGIGSFNGSFYKMLEDCGDTGYGDLLRRTFPGVLMVELSRMGGNPISPYGDVNNIHNTFDENFLGIRNVLNYYGKKFKEKILKK